MVAVDDDKYQDSVLSLETVAVMGKFDASCISMWGRTGLYYCQQIVAWPSCKTFV